MTPADRIRRLVLSTCAAALALAGCAGNGVSADLRAQPKPTSFGSAATGALDLPGADGFSITLASSERAAGLSGTAASDATADPGGSAVATAKVENGGTAAARFQLGHAIENSGAAQADFEIRVRFRYEQDLSSRPSRQFPDGRIELTLFATHQRTRQTLDQYVVAAQSTDEGAGGGTGSSERTFNVTLGPDDAVNVFLSGGVAIDAPDGRSAQCTLRVQGLEIEVRRREAPPVGAGANG